MAVKLRSGSSCRVGTVLFLLYCHFKPHWPLHWPHASPCRTVTINLLLFFFSHHALCCCCCLTLVLCALPWWQCLSSSSSSSSCCAFILFWTSRLPFLSSFSFFPISHFLPVSPSSNPFYPPLLSSYFLFFFSSPLSLFAAHLLFIPLFLFSCIASSFCFFVSSLLLFTPLTLLLLPPSLLSDLSLLFCPSSFPWSFISFIPHLSHSLCSSPGLLFILLVLPFPLLVGPEQRRLKVSLFFISSVTIVVNLDFKPEYNDSFLFLSVSNIDHVVLDEDHSGSRRLQNLWR